MIKDFIRGIAAYFRAFELISDLKLWRYVLIPGLISLALGSMIILSAWGLSDNIGTWLVNWYPWEFGRGVIETIGSILGGIFVAALGLILFKHLVMILAGPFMSPLSEKIERALTGHVPNRQLGIMQVTKEVVRGSRLALRNAIREISLTLILLLLSLIPLFTPITTVLILILQAYYFGFGNMDFTLERHLGVRDSIRFVRSHRSLAIGNGLVSILLLMTVVGFVFVLPLGTIAATVETVKRLKE